MIICNANAQIIVSDHIYVLHRLVLAKVVLTHLHVSRMFGRLQSTILRRGRPLTGLQGDLNNFNES